MYVCLYLSVAKFVLKLMIAINHISHISVISLGWHLKIAPNSIWWELCSRGFPSVPAASLRYLWPARGLRGQPTATATIWSASLSLGLILWSGPLATWASLGRGVRCKCDRNWEEKITSRSRNGWWEVIGVGVVYNEEGWGVDLCFFFPSPFAAAVSLEHNEIKSFLDKMLYQYALVSWSVSRIGLLLGLSYSWCYMVSHAGYNISWYFIMKQELRRKITITFYTNSEIKKERYKLMMLMITIVIHQV